MESIYNFFKDLFIRLKDSLMNSNTQEDDKESDETNLDSDVSEESDSFDETDSGEESNYSDETESSDSGDSSGGSSE